MIFFTFISMFVCNLNYSVEKWKDNFIKSERAKEINRKVAMAKKVNPSMYLPFAGYFVEAYPFDE